MEASRTSVSSRGSKAHSLSSLSASNQTQTIALGGIGDSRAVDEVFVEDALELKGDYIQQYRAHVLVMGDDWAGRFDEFAPLCDVVYLPRTPEISSTQIVTVVRAGSSAA